MRAKVIRRKALCSEEESVGPLHGDLHSMLLCYGMQLFAKDDRLVHGLFTRFLQAARVQVDASNLLHRDCDIQTIPRAGAILSEPAALMDSPSIDSATGSPVSSVDASEHRRPVNMSKDMNNSDECMLGDFGRSICTHAHTLELIYSIVAMPVDENTPLPGTSSEAQRKRKSEGAVKDDSNSADKKGKASTSPKILQSSRHASIDASSDEESPVVTSKPVKRPKLSGGDLLRTDTISPESRPTRTLQADLLLGLDRCIRQRQLFHSSPTECCHLFRVDCHRLQQCCEGYERKFHCTFQKWKVTLEAKED